jgi:hypothetical protein
MKYEAVIAPSLQPMAVDLMSVKPHPKNIRKHKLDAIQRSLQKYGQMKPIVVQESTKYIIAGNGTWSAAAALGWETIAVNFVDVDDHTAMGFLVADNKASDLSAYDTAKLKDALTLLADGPGLFDTLWTVDEYEDLLSQDPAAITTEFQEFKGGYAESAEEMEARLAAVRTTVARAAYKEVPLLIKQDEHAAFVKRLKTVGAKLGETSILGIIFACVAYTEEHLGIAAEKDGANA